MTVVAVDHLLDVVVVVDADALPIAYGVVGPVAAAGNVAGNWRESLPPDPDSCGPLRHPGDGAVARPYPLLPDAPGNGPAMVRLPTRQPKPALDISRVGKGERLRRGATP